MSMRRICLAAVGKVQTRLLCKCVGNTFPVRCASALSSSWTGVVATTQKRFQSSSSDKKFHCSICHKSFRLEMAARVHLQQAHGGDGSIEEGNAPNQEAKATVTAEPTTPKAVPEIKTTPATTQNFSSERRPYRRERLTPTPLNTPDRVIPAHAMEQLLEMWDTVGTKRLGPTFIHSSMILKVFAAKPGDVAEMKSGALNSSSNRPAVAAPSSSPEHIAPYASTTQTVPSPLGGSVVSPFAQEVAQSPFAGSVISPFTEAAAAGTFAPSPFANATSTMPAAVVAASPFVSTEASAPSPFVTSGQTGAAPSPFLPDGATEGNLPTYDYVPSTPHSVAMGGFVPIEDAASSKCFACETCEREFSSYLGLRMHNKDKHGIKLPFLPEEATRRPEHHQVAAGSSLPAFIPSPVDLSHTSPFGTKRLMSAWTDTDIAPYAHAVNNIVVMGTVRNVQKVDDNTSQVAVLVRGDTAEEDETLTLRCFGECHQYVQKHVTCDSLVFSSGSLRLLPVFDAKLNKYHTNAVVFVSLPQGIMTKI